VYSDYFLSYSVFDTNGACHAISLHGIAKLGRSSKTDVLLIGEVVDVEEKAEVFLELLL